MTFDSTSNGLSQGEIYCRQIDRAASYLARQAHSKPTISLTLEVGFDELTDFISDVVVVPGSSVPHFPVSNISKTEIVFGSVKGRSVMALIGRPHVHEGFSAKDVAFPALVARSLGCKTFVFTALAGSLNPAFRPGHLMVSTNHISLFCPDPAAGLNYSELGPTYYDQTDPYSKELSEKVIEYGRDAGAVMQRGTSVFVSGPRFESRADIQMLNAFGADAVQTSTIPEVLALLRAGSERIVSLSAITNMAAGITTARITEEEVASQQAALKPQLRELLKRLMVEQG